MPEAGGFMNTVLATTGAAIALFAGTNLDDMIVLSVLSASSRADGRPQRWQIWAGQYIGITVLVAVSVAAGHGLAMIPEHWLGLMGLVPFGLGIARLTAAIRARRSADQADIAVARGLPGVAAITIANGGDNIAAYTPVFATISAGAAIDLTVVFATGVAVWCVIGWHVASHHRVTGALHRWGHWVIPAVYVLIGVYIFQKTGVFTHAF
jgi:cadmium resistance protein CadD (predicted permease)